MSDISLFHPTLSVSHRDAPLLTTSSRRRPTKSNSVESGHRWRALLLQIQNPLVTSLGRLDKTPFGYLRSSASHRIMIIIIPTTTTTTHAFCDSCLLPQLISTVSRTARGIEDKVGTFCYNSNIFPTSNFFSGNSSPEIKPKCSVTEKIGEVLQKSKGMMIIMVNFHVFGSLFVKTVAPAPAPVNPSTYLPFGNLMATCPVALPIVVS